MNEWERSRRIAERYKQLYPAGSRVMLNRMGDDPNPIPPHTRGTVRYVDDIGTVHTDFDNGRSLGMIPGEDEFRLLNEKELAEEAMNNDTTLAEGPVIRM